MNDKPLSRGQVDRPSAWPQNQLDMLANLWVAGKTAAQIAVEVSRIGPTRTKNSVLGIVHRMGLVKRPSPIQPNPAKAAKPKRPPGRPRVHPIAVPDAAVVHAPVPAEPEAEAEAPPRPKAQRQAGMYDGRTPAERSQDTMFGHARRLAAPPALTVPLGHVPLVRPRSCQWIEGPSRPDPQFCGAVVVPGKPYCAAHCARCYVARERSA